MGLEAQLHPEIPEILSVGNALGDNSMMIKVDPEVTIAHAKRGELEGCITASFSRSSQRSVDAQAQLPLMRHCGAGDGAFQRCVRRMHAGGADVALR
jgi:hypothetical protein